MLSQHLKVNRDSFCGHLFSPVEQPGPGFLGVFFSLDFLCQSDFILNES